MSHELHLEGLRKSFGASLAVDDVSLTLGKGEMVALLGPSGCGKTTTLRMVAGFVQPSAGRILLDQADITLLPPERRDTGMVFQSYALFPHMSVQRNVEFGLRCRRLPDDQVRTVAAEALALVGLSAMQARYPRQLSGGQQQRVALARVLALRPKLLLFDEPLSNLDAKLRVQMRQEIRRLQQDVGITALFVTHDQDEASTIADRIAVMNEGRIEQTGTPAEIYNAPATRFVADFIGTSNLLDGVVEGTDAAGAAFRADKGGRFVVPDQASAGTRGALCIRPEKIDIAAPDTPGAYAGTLQRASRTAGMMEYEVLLQDGPTLVVHEQLRHGIAPREPGTRVGLAVRGEHMRFLTR